jgi:hypothetical protein
MRHPLASSGAASLCGALFLLAGCADDPGAGWTKPGADAATMERDRSECRRMAAGREVATSGSLDQPLGSSPGALPRTSSPRQEYLGDSDISLNRARMIEVECLRGRGYTPASP